MRAINFKAQLALAFGAAVILFACVGGLSYRRILQEDVDQGWVEHTHFVLEKLDAVQLDLANQETGKQDFSLGQTRLIQDLNSVRHLTSDNTKQQGTLDEIEALVTLRSTQFQESVRKSASTASVNVSKSTERITGLIQNMKTEEQELLARRFESASVASRRMKAILGAGGILAILLIVVAGLVVQSEIRKRSRTELELRSAEERYHLLFDSSPIPAWVYDAQSLTILDINAEAVSHYGYSRQEFLSLRITDIRPPEDIPAVLESAAKAPNDAESSGPWRHRKKSGELIDVEVKSYPLLFAGKSARLVAALDVTERNRSEEALRQSEERFRLLVSGVKDYAILMLDPEGRIATWSDAAERIKGYRAEEIIGRHFSHFYTPEDIGSGKPARELQFASEQGSFEDEGWRVRKDGSRFWANVVITALRDRSGGLRGFGKVTRDMTERKRIEQNLQASEERFRNVTETANDAIISADADGRIVYVNRAAEQTFCYSTDELVGQPLTMLMPDRFRNTHLAGFERFLKTGEAQVLGKTLELVGQRHGGAEFPLEISLSTWKTGEGVFFTGILSDITDRKRAEEELRLRNAQLDSANKELEAFSYSVSHDLRAPLRSIDGFSQALLEDCAGKLDETEKSHLDRIRAGTMRMGMLIDDLLNLSRVARAEIHRETVDISELARSVVADLQKRQPERQIEFSIQDSMEAMGDPRLLRLVYENLIGNAWKFTSKRTSARIEVGRINDNGTRTYFICDNGAGFDQAYAGKLFGAFQRLHGMAEFPGTGVGLATVQRIVHRHGGRIWAEGVVGLGASFYFTL